MIKNAVIKTASITSDDHGLLSAWLILDYGDSGQSFGGSPPTRGAWIETCLRALQRSGIFARARRGKP